MIASLREHRRKVLREPLRAVAKRAKSSIASLSYLERGLPPEPWRINALARGYKLSIPDFERLVGASRGGLDGNGHSEVRNVG